RLKNGYMLTVRTSENTVITSFRLISERQDFSSVRTGENTVRARARIQVADQSTISLQDSTQLSVITDGKSHPFTMPYTGVVNLRGYGVWFTDIGGFNLINLGPSANGNLSIWAYAKKGQELTYAIGQSNQFSAAYIRIYKVEGNN
uniref:hypothetical protein n=1 Tax=Parasutterella sp. TaxID=2049037 RepID=UPI003AAA5DFE